jgi:hypothetical protein
MCVTEQSNEQFHWFDILLTHHRDGLMGSFCLSHSLYLPHASRTGL